MQKISSFAPASMLEAPMSDPIRSIFPNNKMVSPIITCIDAIIADLADYPGYSVKLKLVFSLWNLQTFVLCARKLPNDTSLGSFLVRIEDTTRKWADEIPLQLQRDESAVYKDGGHPLSVTVQSFMEEVDQWYVTLLDHPQDPTSLTTDELLEIIAHILDGLSGSEYIKHDRDFREALEALTEQLRFLSCLIWLAPHTSEDFLAHSEIVALDAASLMFAFRADMDDEESHRERQLKISTLVQKIKPINPQVYQAYTQVLSRSKMLLPSTPDKDDKVTLAREIVLDTLISNLWEILLLDTCVVCMKDQLKELYGGLRSFRNILKQHPNKFDLKIGAVLCDAAVFSWPLLYQTNPEVDLGLGLQDLLQTINNILAEVEEQDPQIPKFDFPRTTETSFDSVIKYIMKITADVLNTFCGKRQEIEVKEATSTSNQMPSQRTPSAVNEVVGFDNEARSIMERLRRGSRSLRIIAIVGMPGSGKTTLATKAFNDSSVMRHFHVRAWCPISQTLNRKKVFLDLLNQIDPKSRSEKGEDDLADELRKSLKGRRYLIFLDDVWEIDTWNRLTGGLLFPDDNIGSRIILTSRRHDAAPRHMLDQEPHSLRPLEKEESLELFQKKLLPQNSWPLELTEILGQFADVCKGLPLTIVIVAGLLATTEPGGWKEILDDLSSGRGSVTARCRNTLELSYKSLPNDLRSCLLYFGVFEEDQEVSVRKLIRLWIAEGFVQKTEVESLEDAAEDYLKDLIGRSLILVAKQRSDGGVKTCRVHDLLRDFFLEKAKNEHFFHFLKGRHELFAFSEPSNLRRLCIQSDTEDFKRSQLFCPGAHTLHFNCSPVVCEKYGKPKGWLPNISFVIHSFKLLKVLDLQQIQLVNGFPDEIVLLVQLAFLAIAGIFKHIPSSIARLSNLETLILDTYGASLLPGSLWSLQKLQYLYIRVGNYYNGCGILAIENLDRSPILYELHRFSGAAIPPGSMGRLLKKFPNIRRLKCRLLKSADEKYTVVVDFQSQLESLHIMYNPCRPNIFEFRFPNTLTKLSLTSLRLSLRSISMIGKLPTLEVLKFDCVVFQGNTWEMKEGEFLNLIFLELSSIYLRKWTACDDDQFGCLKKLVFKSIYNFEEIPSCLGSIPTLEMINVSKCSFHVIEKVRQIKEQQLMFGNSSLKINIVGKTMKL